MKFSKYVIDAGLDSIPEVCKITGVARTTLNRWWREKPLLIRAVVTGAAAIKQAGI